MSPSQGLSVEADAPVRAQTFFALDLLSICLLAHTYWNRVATIIERDRLEGASGFKSATRGSQAAGDSRPVTPARGTRGSVRPPTSGRSRPSGRRTPPTGFTSSSPLTGMRGLSSIGVPRLDGPDMPEPLPAPAPLTPLKPLRRPSTTAGPTDLATLQYLMGGRTAHRSSQIIEPLSTTIASAEAVYGKHAAAEASMILPGTLATTSPVPGTRRLSPMRLGAPPLLPTLSRAEPALAQVYSSQSAMPIYASGGWATLTVAVPPSPSASASALTPVASPRSVDVSAIAARRGTRVAAPESFADSIAATQDVLAIQPTSSGAELSATPTDSRSSQSTSTSTSASLVPRLPPVTGPRRSLAAPSASAPAPSALPDLSPRPPAAAALHAPSPPAAERPGGAPSPRALRTAGSAAQRWFTPTPGPPGGARPQGHAPSGPRRPSDRPKDDSS
jgi:hypothetical protein